MRFDVDRGGMVLGGTVLNARYAYVANNPQSTVSKVDLITGNEVGRYLVGLSYNGAANSPSRTAIDSRGNAYVASRAFDRDGSVTKIAGDQSFCIDRNLNGRIDTSGGGGDIRPWGQDECVAWTVKVGNIYPLPRALAIDRNDRIWVGLYNNRRFDVLDPSDGHLIRSVGVALHAYGAAIGRDGMMWFPNGCCGRPTIQAVNTETFETTGTFAPPAGMCWGSYGIAVDATGRVLIGGYPDSCLSRFTPSTGVWERFNTAAGSVRGVTVDAEGRVWATSHNWDYNPHWMTSWAPDGTDRRLYTLRDSGTGAVCSVPIGIGADFQGRMWTPCQYTSRVAIVDPDTGQVQVRASIGPNPYTYSDFTGFLRATITAPEGSYTRVYDSRFQCRDGMSVVWSQLYWDADAPENTHVNFEARVAGDDGVYSRSVLIVAAPGGASPANLMEVLAANGLSPTSRYLEIRVELQSLDSETSPVFRSMDTVFFCRCDCDVNEECTEHCDCDGDC
jgi:DNA-binding beta-propeller fold protein YncE